MNINDFDFELDSNLIAQTPLEKRDHSNLIIVDKFKNELAHKKFYEIIDYLRPGDILVRNNTKVIPARLIGTKAITNAKIELLLLNKKGKDLYQCLIGNASKVHENTEIIFAEGKLIATCLERFKGGLGLFHLKYSGDLYELLDEIANMPLPPYIKERLNDASRYQTIYAKNPGSAAAPTAGFHFTDELLQKIKDKKIKVLDITLHVGLGTFLPVKVDNILEHKMHSEYYELDEETALILEEAKMNKQRIIAIGTTTCRTLEAIYNKYNCFKADCNYTDIFIYPGYKFRAIDGLITNFHLPKSTLLMLVTALAGEKLIKQAYQEAIERKYRFFSFGDAMFIC